MKLETALTVASFASAASALSLSYAPVQRIFNAAMFNKDPEFESPHRDAPLHDTCPRNPPLSCSATSAGDSCCYESTNGVFLLAQLWDYSPVVGANDTFTLHGLWCDKCQGGYNQFCNPSWKVHDVQEVLHSTNRSDLLDDMNKVWLSLDGDHERLWLHEFNKHGTCMYTASPSCYDSKAESSSKYQYASDFFVTSMELWRELPTFDWLAEAGIHPSDTETFKVKDFQNVLSSKLGVDSVGLMCDHNNALDQVFYYFNLKGSVASGQFFPRDSFNGGSCRDGFRWYPKGSKSRDPPPGKGPSNKGYLKLSDQPGCLISNGHWYTSGTCATFRLKKSKFGGVELHSSKGACDIVDGKFMCARANTAAQFTMDGSKLVYGGEERWSANKHATGTTQVPIHPGPKDDGPPNSVEFTLHFNNK